MKSLSFLFAFAAPALLASTLAACGTHAPSQTVYGPSAGRVGMGGIMGDQQAMCEVNRRMKAARTPEERQALVDKYMAGMSAETRQQYMRMMRERCG